MYNFSQSFLGLDTNCYVTESPLSLLFVLTTCLVEFELPGHCFQSCCLKFDEFLAENIRSQLVNFHGTRVFRFQSFLLKMFSSHNEDNLQFPELVITDEMTEDYCKFMNCLMAEIYSIFFQERLPRVLPEMRKHCNFPLVKGQETSSFHILKQL